MRSLPDQPLLLIAPPSAADHARYFRVAPNDLRVVTNVDHNVHTILDPNRTATDEEDDHWQLPPDHLRHLLRGQLK